MFAHSLGRITRVRFPGFRQGLKRCVLKKAFPDMTYRELRSPIFLTKIVQAAILEVKLNARCFDGPVQDELLNTLLKE